MKNHSIATALSITTAFGCLLLGPLCAPALADGFKFPTIPNPFKKAATSESSRSARPSRATGANINDQEATTASDESSSFALPKPKLPKFDLPNMGSGQADSSTAGSSATGSRSRPSQTTRQRRANPNRSSQPSVLDKFSRGTKSFFGKAKSTLMPWANDTASTTPVRPGAPSGSGSRHSTRTNRSRSSTPVREASASNGFSFPWSKPKPAAEEKEVNSATDFLRLDRPKYY